MKILPRELSEDERGVEPTVMKILVGVILVSIGLGIGVTMYQRFGSTAQNYLNYDVTVGSGSASVSIGGSTEVDVTVSTTTGYDGQVILVAEGYPEDDVSISFSPETGDPEFYSTMSINVGENAETGSHAITIKARQTEGDGEKTAKFDLTITE